MVWGTYAMLTLTGTLCMYMLDPSIHPSTQHPQRERRREISSRASGVWRLSCRGLVPRTTAD